MSCTQSEDYRAALLALYTRHRALAEGRVRVYLASSIRMSGVIESERANLEELEGIENAISKRFKRNPFLLSQAELAPTKLMQPRAVPVKRSHKETILQQHEIKFFVDRYRELVDSIVNNRKEKVLDEPLARLTDASNSYQAFDDLLASIKEQHEMYETQHDPQHNKRRHFAINTEEDVALLYEMLSSRPDNMDKSLKKAPRKYLLSRAASHIDLNSIFSSDEEYGKSLDLHRFHDDYKKLSGDETLSYVEYLSLYDSVPFLGGVSNRALYESYLDEVFTYQLEFIRKSRPFEQTVFVEIEKLEVDIDVVGAKVNLADGSTNDKGEIYCAACDKWFAKESVYKGHLSGKKHLKNEKKTSQASSEGDLAVLKEVKVRFLGKFLQSERESAIASVERKANSTEREQLLERAAAENEESQLTDIGSGNDSDLDGGSDADSDGEDDDFNAFKNLPVGADGQPMPFWLYKLQGYHKSYTCEVCGDVTYKGRVVFSKHFTGSTHQQGLKMLGINDESLPLFKNITKIDESIELWRRIKKETRIRDGESENAIEVEDADGNVMSKKDYEELKRQGLL